MNKTSPSTATNASSVKTQHKRRQAPYETSKGLVALAPEGRYRIAQFIPSIIGIGKTRWYAGVKSGEFPAPVVQRKRMTMWRGADILHAAAQLGRAE